MKAHLFVCFLEKNKIHFKMHDAVPFYFELFR